MIVDLRERLSAGDRGRITPLFEAAERADRRPALSDHLALQFGRGGGDGFLAAIAHDTVERPPVAYAQTSAANDALAMEVVVDPSSVPASTEAASAVVTSLLDHLDRDDHAAVNWWIHGSDVLSRVAELAGFVLTRRLHQMRRPLPAERHAQIGTRAFVVGGDEEEWVRVNNRAFAGHGEQGGWSVETLREREAAPWFDPDGFRMHDIDGRLAAFCWTKVHEPTAYEEERLGEIYVIAVDPDFHGRGLGSELTLAGLDHLTARDITTAILYVDADNHAAVRLYERLGFDTTRTSAAYRREPPAGREGESAQGVGP